MTWWSWVELIIVVGVLVLAIALTAHWGGDTGISRKLIAFLGILVSACPLVAVVLYVICRRRAPRYANICGTMGVFGVVLGVVLYSGRLLLGAHA